MTTRQEQQIILLGIYAFVWDGVPELLVLFEFSIGGNRIRLCSQLPKNDACKQARVGLAHLPCFCAERYLQASFYKMFPGDRNLCGIEVFVGKRYDHVFSHRVSSSICPFTRVLLLNLMLIGPAM